MSDWPKGPTAWIEDRMCFVSVPFTWNLNDVRTIAAQQSFLWDTVTVGGPAIKLSQDFKKPFVWPSDVIVDYGDIGGVLERVNPLATRTSIGCPNFCGFCGVSSIEPEFHEMLEWVSRPLVCDSNFLACSKSHRVAVYAGLERLGAKPGGIDFNQGLDARKLTEWDAIRLSILKATCRLSCDTGAEIDIVKRSIDMLREQRVPLKRLSVYALIGWTDTPVGAWDRCKEIGSWGVYCCPMWFHELDAMAWNAVTKKQKALGWDEEKRKHIMGYFWQHRGAPIGASDE